MLRGVLESKLESEVGSILEYVPGRILRSVFGSILRGVLGSILGGVPGSLQNSVLWNTFRAYLDVYSETGWECVTKCNCVHIEEYAQDIGTVLHIVLGVIPGSVVGVTLGTALESTMKQAGSEQSSSIRSILWSVPRTLEWCLLNCMGVQNAFHLAVWFQVCNVVWWKVSIISSVHNCMYITVSKSVCRSTRLESTMGEICNGLLPE